jgi:transposase
MKARYRPYNPEEGYFTLIDPEDIKKHNPLLTVIDSFVEDHISVEPFSQSARNELEGAPAVHPRMMLKVIFYSYAKGIRTPLNNRLTRIPKQNFKISLRPSNFPWNN